MTRRRTAFCSCLLVLALSFPAFAQQEEPQGAEAQDELAPPEEGSDLAPPEEGSELAPPPSDPLAPPAPTDTAPAAGVTKAAGKPGSPKATWQDIVVIPRKPVLKGGRVELMPQFGITINDNLIQHYSVGGELNYFLTDILSIGLQGMYFFDNVLDSEFYTRYHLNRIPSLNKYKYHANASFAYVPLYGKFALFNKQILHFECFVTAGIGITGTEIIPRNYENEPFTNPASLTFPVGVGGRMFINDWIAVNVSFRNYIMLDKFEPVPRPLGMTADEAKEEGDTDIINSVMFTAGVSFFLPTSFKYTTFR